MTRRSQPPYPPELRERAVRMVAEVESDYDSPWAAMNAVATKLGVGTGETVRKWVRQAEIDGGVRPGTTTEESEEVKRRWCSQPQASRPRMRRLLLCVWLCTCVGDTQPPQRPALKPAGGSRAVQRGRTPPKQSTLLASSGPPAEGSLAHIGRSAASRSDTTAVRPSFKW